MNDWQGQFAQGFTATGQVDNGYIVLIFLALLVGLGAVWFVADRYRRTQSTASRKKATRDEPETAGTAPRFVPIPGRINPLQQKIIQEMINEFRKQETAAQSIPSAILEKYSEFFFNNVKRMKTNDKEVDEFVNMNYPIQEGFSVEMDFQASGALHLIKSKVIEITGKNIIVEFNNQIPAFLKKGMSLQINYSVGKHFLQGSTVITDVRPDVGIILHKPTEVALTSERRYNRLTLKKAAGTLHEPLTDFQSPVKVLDLSLEGVRVQVGRPLDKTKIYQLTFEAEDGGHALAFGPIECAPSKAFLTGSGTYETGLVFLYLDVGAKARLLQFMKHLVVEMQNAAKAAGSEAADPVAAGRVEPVAKSRRP